jgi:SAM-dependent methyltransferase
LPVGRIDSGRKFRNENLERQTFDDASFDLVITQDVFEHVFRPDLAIAEIARTLRPGGAHICTVPIILKNAPSKRRASFDDRGGIIHHLEPVYHANPISELGSLVTVDWGYDILSYLSQHSGLDTAMVIIDDLDRGIRAEYIDVLIGRKLRHSVVL